jgi:hypothetical protein
MPDHMQNSTNEHLMQLVDVLTTLQEDITVLRQHLSIVQRQDKQYIWVIPTFESRKGPLYSPKFVLSGHTWYIGVDADSPDLVAGVYLFAEGHTKRVDFKLTLFHAEHGNDKVHVVSDWRKDYKGKGWGPLKFIDRPGLSNSGFLVDGCIRIGVRMESDPYD